MSLSFFELRDEAERAMITAKQTFLSGLTFEYYFNTDKDDFSSSTGVFWRDDLKPKKSSLYINPNDATVQFLISEGLSVTDAWLLVLAHESGHLILNNNCHKVGDNPNYTDAQLKAIGFTADEIKVISPSHKETSVEAYCDCILAQQSIALLGQDQGFQTIEKIAKLRALRSAKLLPFQTDEYATSPILFEISHTKNIPLPTPSQAARFCLKKLEESWRGRSTMALDYLKDRLKKLRKTKQDSTNPSTLNDKNKSKPP